jgi:hypothetical protein
MANKNKGQSVQCHLIGCTGPTNRPNKRKCGPKMGHSLELPWSKCLTFFGRPWWRGSEVRWWSVFSLLFPAGHGGEGATESFIDLFFLFGCWCCSWCLSASRTCSSWLPCWWRGVQFLVLAVPIRRSQWSFPLVAIRWSARLHTGLLGWRAAAPKLHRSSSSATLCVSPPSGASPATRQQAGVGFFRRSGGRRRSMDRIAFLFLVKGPPYMFPGFVLLFYLCKDLVVNCQRR